jgi:hypothetical protein
MKVFLLTFALLFLTLGCATANYVHQTKGQAEFEQDKAECEQFARQSLAARGIEDC